jgi:hypothetical protein
MHKTKAAINTIVINSLNARFHVQVLSLSIIHATLYHIFCLCSAKNQCGAGVFLRGVGRWPGGHDGVLSGMSFLLTDSKQMDVFIG